MATTGCVVVLALAVSACGGGGGGVRPIPAPIAPTPTPTPPPPPPPPPPTNYNTTEYQRSNAAVAANAISAYNKGATGRGVKIGIVDTGINPNIAEFAGRIDAASTDVAGNRGVSDEDGHGTAVTAVAAAAKNDINMHGVAFDATIVSLRADAPGSCADTTPEGGCTFFDPAIAIGIDAARLAGARVINMSLGGDPPTSELLAAIGRAVNAGIIIVISAGNDGQKPEGVNADPFALVSAQNFPGSVIIAGSVGVDDGSGGTSISQISTFSNRAGAGAQYYLMALGYAVRAPSTDGLTYLWSGTSFSAPTISGAAALLAQAFPTLTGRQIIDILFASADDLGATGIDAIYGRGRLNLDRAFQPMGTTSMAGSQTLVSTGTNGDLPPSSGDASGNGSMGVVILDGYSRAFAMNIAATLKQAAQARPLARALQGDVRVAGASAGPLSIAMTVSQKRDGRPGFQLDRLGIGPEDARQSRLIAGSAIARLDSKTAAAFGFAEGAKAIERKLSGAEAGAFLIAKDIAGDPGFAAKRAGSMALRRTLGPLGVTLSAESGSVWQDVRTSATGSPYSWTSLSVDRAFGSTWLSAGFSRLDEKQTMLGGRLGAALGGGGSSSLFVDVEARRDLGSSWRVSATARRGWTDFASGKLQTSAYVFDVSKLGLLNEGDRLGVRLSQPLRVEKGGLNLFLPTAYDYGTLTATRSLSRFALSPSGREMDAELSYASGVLGGDGWLGANLFLRRQPDHVARANADLGAAVRFSLDF